MHVAIAGSSLNKLYTMDMSTRAMEVHPKCIGSVAEAS